MNRIKPYDIPHKALRNALSQLTVLSGRMNYSDPKEVETLYHLAMDVFDLLTAHQTDENEVTLAELEKRCPGSSRHDREEHVKIHAGQEKLERMISKIATNSSTAEELSDYQYEFYLAVSEFHGKYLEHTAHEERVTQALLWQYFSDDELISFGNRIRADIPPELWLIWFRFLVPAQSHPERVGFLTGFKQTVPPPFFTQGMEVINQVLTEKEYSDLQAALL